MKLRTTLLACLIGVLPIGLAAQDQTVATSTLASDMIWKELAPGLSMAPLWQEDGKDTGLMLKFSAGYVGIKHGHSSAYHGVTMQGIWQHVDGDGTLHALPQGSLAHQPAQALHSDNCISEIPCIILLHVDGDYDFFLPK